MNLRDWFEKKFVLAGWDEIYGPCYNPWWRWYRSTVGVRGQPPVKRVSILRALWWNLEGNLLECRSAIGRRNWHTVGRYLVPRRLRRLFKKKVAGTYIGDGTKDRLILFDDER